METALYILLNMKIAGGFETYGKFWIGNDSRAAYDLFDSLHGNLDVSEENLLCIELIELRDGLPVNLKMLRCNIDQLSVNCKLITRETFKRLNLAVH
jgi:hypothetical protein